MKILLTGASGFVGTNFIKYAKGFEITPVDLRSKKIQDIDFSGIDTVLHLAALAHQTKPAPENEYYKINRDLAYSLAKKAKEGGVKHFIFMSTAKVFGETNNSPWNENSPCEPKDAYAQSKLEAEKLIITLQNDAFKVAIIRPPLIYGAEIKANMLALVKLIKTYPILPFGGIQNKRHLVFVGNLIALLNSIINNYASGIFIACDPTPLSTSELINVIAEKLNKKILLIRIPNLLNRILLIIKPSLSDRLYGSFLLDNGLTCKKLNFTPPYSIEEGIDEMIHWYKQPKFH
jgi:UDP-glucose 4-epimerase